MANQEQLKILRQGVEVWNRWREENPKVGIDLSTTNLRNITLRGAILTKANLYETDFRGASLANALLAESDLRGADFRDAILTEANLSKSNLRGVDFTRANLQRADCSEADLTRAILRHADLSGARLRGVDFHEAYLGYTIFARVDLSKVYGLETISHDAPSTIGIDSNQLTKGGLPEIFLRGCGLNDWEIESAKLYKLDLSNQEINNIIYKIFDLRANQSIQISPLFISYSHNDIPFVEKLEPYLTNKGIRFWRDVHNATAGRLEKQIDHAMRQNPTVLLILSENSTASDWVEHEARLAREIEKEIGRDVLCPIALDYSWKTAKWPARLMEQIKEYNILDFSKWEDDKSFEQVFNKMISGLDMFYKPNVGSSK